LLQLYIPAIILIYYPRDSKGSIFRTDIRTVYLTFSHLCLITVFTYEIRSKMYGNFSPVNQLMQLHSQIIIILGFFFEYFPSPVSLPHYMKACIFSGCITSNWCCESGFILVGWIRMRICIGNTDLDPEGPK
jgi:hypothetical protein